MNQHLPTRATQLPVAETVEDLEVFGLKGGRMHRLREGGFQAYVNDETARRVDAGVAPFLDLIAGKVSPDDLGSAALEDVTAFATAAQGSSADTALQPATGVVRIGSFASAPMEDIPDTVGRVFVEDVLAAFRQVIAEPNHDLKFFNGVWWEVDEPELSPTMVGMVADWDGSTGTDNTAALAKLLHAHSVLKRPIRFAGGQRYYCASSVVWNDDYLNIDGDFSSALCFPPGVGYMLNIGVGRAAYATKALTANVTFGTKVLSVASTAGIESGDIVLIRSNKAWYNDPRPNPLVSNAAISFTSALGTTTTALLDAAFAVSGSIVGQSITFTSGANAGMARRITAYDNSTKTVTFTPAVPSAVASGVRYVVPEAVKGQTCRVGRIIDSTSFEVVDTIEDGYYIVDADASLIKEEVNLVFYKPYSPRVRGIRLEGNPESTAGVGVGIYAATDVDVDVVTKNCRSAGGQFTRLHRGSIHVVVGGANRVETGYGSQISECAAIDVSGRGWNNRRLFDVSGNAPSDSIRVHGLHVDGGGLQADGEEYYPLGTVSNYGVGSHGAARKTIYENNSFYGVEHAIYERGRGAIVRHNYFGPGVKYPVSSQFGGKMLVENNVIDAGLFDNVEGATESETSGFDGSAYAECVLLLGANLLSLDPADSIIVRGNVGAVRANIVQFQTVGGTARTLPNIRSYGNDIEFFPPSPSTPVGAYGKMAGSSAASVVLSGGRHDNAMRTAAANLQPTMLTDATIIFSTAAGTKIEYGFGKWTMRLADDTAGYIPVAMGSRDKMRVDISLEEDDTNFFSGWVKKGSATLLQVGGNNSFEGLAVEPNGTNGTDGKCQLHYAAGRLFIGHRLSGNRTYNVQVTPTS